MNGIKVIVCGGRDFRDRDAVFNALDRADNKRRIGLVIQGAAKGADTLALLWSIDRGVQCLSVPADWNAHGDAAGPIRNEAMLDLLPDAVIAFPGGKGTAHMVKLARDAGIPVWEPYRV
jgi:YspA, cpYpsA-related SLOG family